MCAETPREAEDWADRAMADLRTQTGDSHSDYYTRAAANWIPDLCRYVHELATEVASLSEAATRAERERDEAKQESAIWEVSAVRTSRERDTAMDMWRSACRVRDEVGDRLKQAELDLAACRDALEQTDVLLNEWYELAYLPSGGYGGDLVQRTFSRTEKNESALGVSADGEETT